MATSYLSQCRDICVKDLEGKLLRVLSRFRIRGGGLLECIVLQRIAVCRSALQCAAVHCSVPQCIAVCCGVCEVVVYI